MRKIQIIFLSIVRTRTFLLEKSKRIKPHSHTKSKIFCVFFFSTFFYQYFCLFTKQQFSSLLINNYLFTKQSNFNKVFLFLLSQLFSKIVSSMNSFLFIKYLDNFFCFFLLVFIGTFKHSLGIIFFVFHIFLKHFFCIFLDL